MAVPKFLKTWTWVDAHALGRGPGQFNAAAFGDDVDVLARTIKQQVTNEASDDEGALTTLVSKFADTLEYGMGEVRGQVHERRCKGRCRRVGPVAMLPFQSLADERKSALLIKGDHHGGDSVTSGFC